MPDACVDMAGDKMSGLLDSHFTLSQEKLPEDRWELWVQRVFNNTSFIKVSPLLFKYWRKGILDSLGISQRISPAPFRGWPEVLHQSLGKFSGILAYI